MKTREQAEQDLRDWAVNNARRDDLVRDARLAGLSKLRIHELTGIARTTIDRILENTMSKPVSVTIAQPFASSDGRPTLEIDFPTTPGFRSGATISTQTAKELVLAIEAKLEEIDAQR